MNVTYKIEPWPHYEIENFLDSETFNQILDYANTHNVEDGKRINKFIGHEKLNFLQQSKNTFSKLLNEVGVEHTIDKIRVEFSACGPGYVYGIHADGDYKTFTFVLNISPTGTGTRVYTENRPEAFVKECEWIQNGGIAFIRTDNSWHSYRNELEVPRYSMNFILYK
jgi:hypothetical protein